jgi:hypothetical protein
MSLLDDITKLIDRLPEGIHRAEDTIAGTLSDASLSGFFLIPTCL